MVTIPKMFSTSLRGFSFGKTEKYIKEIILNNIRYYEKTIKEGGE